MKDTASLTEQLAAFLVSTRPADLPLAVLDAAKYYTLDWLGSALAGTGTLPGRMLLDHAASQGDGPATILGLDVKRGAETAALANGALSHIVEMDDLHRASVLHPATVVIPAALAVAEWQAASGPEFLTALVLGYEVAIRIGEAVGRSHYRFWHNTSTCGIFGAAAAAGWLLGLGAEQMAWALGNAGTMAAGLWEFNTDGAMSKHLHTGRAAASGVLAADLARRGFTGARHILEGERGFFAATSHDAQPARVTSGLAAGMASYRITGVSIKPHASCRHTHSAIDAALAIRARIGESPERFAGVEVQTYQAALALTDNANPADPYAAKFSMQYNVSTALWRGSAGLADFSTAAIANPGVRALLDRVRLSHSVELEEQYPVAWPAQVMVTLDNGRRVVETVRFPKGDPENPLNWLELENKYREMVAGAGLKAGIERTIEQVHSLDRQAQIEVPQP